MEREARNGAPQTRDRSRFRRLERSRISGAPHRKSHSALKTRVNALMALHRIRDTAPNPDIDPFLANGLWLVH
jgi:hypothetical protein